MTTSVTLTFTARDAAHAARIAAAVAAVDEGAEPNSTLVAPGKSFAGWSYRALADARRAGVLEAALTTEGLRFTREAFEAFEARKAESRRGKRAAAVVDLTAQRIAALERATGRKARRG